VQGITESNGGVVLEEIKFYVEYLAEWAFRRDADECAQALYEYNSNLEVSMSDDNLVLISRTKVSKNDWNKLKLIAQLLTEKGGKDVTREDLTSLAVNSTVKYYEKELGI
jgi:hypothetical protein